MKDFILPDIGEGIIECEIVEWLVAEGDQIVEDQPVADVMTDKALVQIPAMHSGVVQKLYYAKGDIAKVHEPLFSMDVEGTASTSDEPPVDEGIVQEQATVAESGATVDFILPDIGEGIVECELVEWLVTEGQVIEEDQAVADVMTDKALVQIPAKYSGRVVKLYYAKGDIAKVHTPLFSIERSDLPQTPVELAPAPVKTTSAPKTLAAGGDKAIKSSGKALASPAVRRVAREMNIDLADVQGSGKKGRVLKEDLLNFRADAVTQTASKSLEKATSAVSPAIAPTAAIAEDRTTPIRGMQAAMARQMQDSVSTIPHFTVSEEIEMDSLIAARKMLKPEFEKQGVKLSFMPFFIKALSLVPNIKNVQALTLFDVAKRAQELVELGREGRVPADDLKGGTVSISNIGTLGGTTATPVINKPEVAIVALGKMQKLPRFDADGNVKAVNIMHISWSGDHRVIDGATMVRFNNVWKSYIENPLKMLTDLR